MSWFTKKNDQNKTGSVNEMTPLQVITHLCACIQLSDGSADHEEKVAWISTISTLFPDFSEKRAETFINEAHTYLSKITENDFFNYVETLLVRINAVLSEEQIKQLGPKIAEIIEADGIVMTSEMKIAMLIEKSLSIKINLDKEL